MTKNNTTSDNIQQPDRLMTTEATLEMLGGISAVTLWRMVKAGKIPKPIKLNERGNNLYRESWIRNYIDSVDLNIDPTSDAKDFATHSTVSQKRVSGRFVEEAVEVEEKPTAQKQRSTRRRITKKPEA